MRYLKNLRDHKAHKLDDPSKIEPSKPEFDSKAKFREWCKKSDTDHVFYSLAEGDSPGERISEDNPVNAMTGFAIDYDAPLDWDIVDKQIEANHKGAMPTWRTRTNSGYIRTVYEFQKKLPIAPELYGPFMKELASLLGVERIFAGFDKTTLEPTKYFELGTDWVKIGEPLEPTLYRTALLKAASKSPPKTGATAIPIDAVAKEVEERWPDRWNGEFNVGSRGPLFWVEPFVEREGCQVTEEGIVCYSDRDGRGFLSWSDLLGPKFVEEYETKKYGSLLDQYWFNGKNFYKLNHGRAVTVPRDQLIMELRRDGFSARAKKGKPCSEVELAILAISNENRIDEVAPVVFSDERVVEYNSHRILNTSNVDPVQPADSGDPAKCPLILGLIDQMFVDGTDVLKAWIKRSYEAVLYKKRDQGQCMIFVGPTNRGKSLLSNRIISALMGGFADASEYAAGQTNFNKDLAGKAAWVIDDTVSAASFQDQRKATEVIKRIVANPRIEYNAKYADAVTIPWTGRVMLSVNLDANSLSVIPSLDSSNRDKIIALRVRDDANSEFPPNDELEATIAEQLPYFARYILDWEVPDKVKGYARYGVISFIDKSIASAAYDNSSRSSVAELVEFFAKKARTWVDETDENSFDENGDMTWTGTLTEFQVGLHAFNDGKNVGMSNNLETVRRGMLILEETSKANSTIRPVSSVGFGGGKLWTINLEQRYDIGASQTQEAIVV